MFSLKVSGADSTFQWQYSDSGGFIDVPDDAIHSGSSSDTLIINDVPYEFNNRQYRCLVSYGGLDSVNDTISDTVTITLNNLTEPVTIIGPDRVCFGATEVQYYVDSYNGVEGYKWLEPDGSEIIGPKDIDSITLDFRDATTDALFVIPFNN